ncbi:unnamed protein product [Diatraea saccharalis]|uniref:Translation initiation factor eIF2B subunit delta n=1 Tax=Diatraea saccharalis TaxID=40085 RepID=A0A9N9RFM3_9NEOP|nr:unnamed protein product [Diatraea saccharalis]
MSSNDEKKSRDEVLAAREAKKLSKQKAKNKGGVEVKKETIVDTHKSGIEKDNNFVNKNELEQQKVTSVNKCDVEPATSKGSTKCIDEVDRAAIKPVEVKLDEAKTKDEIKAERAAKKAAKQAKKRKDDKGDVAPVAAEMTVKDVVETLKDIANVAREVQNVTAKVQAISMEPKKVQSEDSGQSKAKLRAERRAKQEAQRAAKQATVQQQAVPTPKVDPKSKQVQSPESPKEDKIPKAKSVEKTLTKKSQSVNRVNWFEHLHMQHDKEYLTNIPINSNLHPAIIKLGVQLATRVVSGSNARCIALLDALKKMVREYSLPARTEFGRGLEAALGASLQYLWRLRQPSASQENAVKFLRHHITQLPNNVDEFDAKKTLQEEIDRYIKEQIDMAGQAISIAVREKISDGDNILTYGCSSLVERILREAWAGGVRFRAVVVGARGGGGGGARMLRRLRAHRVPCTYADITALSYVMKHVNKVIVGASALLVNGWVVAGAGTAQAALAARARNVPVLVACETHKFSERVQTDAFVYNEIGDPDELIDKSDSNSPLKDWRSNPNLTPLNLTYDVTPPSLVTAVVTELAILPCTSAPVVLRFKLSEYGV